MVNSGIHVPFSLFARDIEDQVYENMMLRCKNLEKVNLREIIATIKEKTSFFFLAFPEYFLIFLKIFSDIVGQPHELGGHLAKQHVLTHAE